MLYEAERNLFLFIYVIKLNVFCKKRGRGEGRRGGKEEKNIFLCTLNNIYLFLHLLQQRIRTHTPPYN